MTKETITFSGNQANLFQPGDIVEINSGKGTQKAIVVGVHDTFLGLKKNTWWRRAYYTVRRWFS